MILQQYNEESCLEGAFSTQKTVELPIRLQDLLMQVLRGRFLWEATKMSFGELQREQGRCQELPKPKKPD